MYDFEQIWRNRITSNLIKLNEVDFSNQVSSYKDQNPIPYTKRLIEDLRNNVIEEKIKKLFCMSACHMPHSKLDKAKEVYQKTSSISLAREVLEQSFKEDIKQYKQLSDGMVEDIINQGMGAAGILMNGDIIATKIPSRFHEYYKESDPLKKKSLYCHCPRVRKMLLDNQNLDSIYCNCGGGFYQDIWETITDQEVQIEVLKNLFDGDNVCQFKIKILPKE